MTGKINNIEAMLLRKNNGDQAGNRGSSGGAQGQEEILMQIRYWIDRRCNILYLEIKDVSYSERQMRRIMYKIIQKVGRYIGELE